MKAGPEPMDDCVFCKIVAGEAPASVLYEDAEVMAFMDISPVTNGHTLVIPKHRPHVFPPPVAGNYYLLRLISGAAGAKNRNGIPACVHHHYGHRRLRTPGLYGPVNYCLRRGNA